MTWDEWVGVGVVPIAGIAEIAEIARDREGKTSQLYANWSRISEVCANLG